MKKQLCIIISSIICISAAIPSVSYADEAPWKFTSTFIQNWYCRDWTEERWEQEFTAAKSAGFDSLILQSTYDIACGDCTGDKQDMSAYPSAESFCMYQSGIPATYHSSQNNGDALELALKAAKETDMQLWLGTVSDDMWWNYGWGAPSGYFNEWSIFNADLCTSLIDEIWLRYGTDYDDQIAGWYYTNEIWNIDAACDGSDSGEYARIIGENINSAVTAIKRNCPEKPLIISPFYNTDISAPEQFGSFISDLISSSGLRTIDIYAPQDGGGREYSPEIIRKWAEAQKKAVSGHMRFWINNECFDKEYTAKPVSQLRRNYNATADLAENNILFSWNHYYESDSALSSQFKTFSAETITGDVNGDGEFTVADIVLFQKWLLAVPDAHLRNWQAADLCTDGRPDVFDMILMRRTLTNSQKGIVLDNSNHTVIQNCEICDTGAEAIAIRDGSSYCTVKSCNIHDTGLVSPGYGEGVYIGSSKEKTEFDFNCNYNKVIGFTFRNVAAEHVDVKEYTTGTEISGIPHT